MNLDQIETKCFILALFIRDDGERFLLGSRAFEFKDSQLHFVANTYQNDVVEVQGNDGMMLAGQVRRSSSQPFDGYIGDSSVNRSTIEQYRKQFFQFFRKNHYYTVVYIMPDKSAIQRRKGFIVEAPEVKELYQLFPEYHISMNFEDINYYNYEEDSDGQEIFGESVDLKMGTSAQGGLIWGNQGQSSISGEGTSFTLYNTIDGGSISDVKIKGNTSQQTYSGKNLINIYGTPSWVGGGTTYSITNGVLKVTGNWFVGFLINVDANTDYTITAGIENIVGTSGKISVYDSSRAWLSGGPTFNTRENTSIYVLFYAGEGTSGEVNYSNVQLEKSSIATSFEPYVGGIPSPNPSYPQTVNVVTGEQTITISDGNSQSQTYTIDLGSLELCKIGTYQDYIYKSSGNWYKHAEVAKISSYAGETIATDYISSTGQLSTGATVYYGLGTATDTQITDATLISDLDTLSNATVYDAQTSFAVTSTNQVAILAVTADSTGGGGIIWDEIGAVWEIGSGGGPVTVSIDSIDNVYPVWELSGPVVNPQLSILTTNTTLQYTGSVTASQTLRIDMFNKTATLNGASVVGNISGDWVYMQPGTNRITYVADNADAPNSTLWWQEIVG